MRRTVLLVDDHDWFRSMFRRVLEADGFEVVGESADGEAALEAAERLQPEIVIVDVQLPGLDGFEVTDRLVAAGRDTAVVLISTRGASAYGIRLAESRACGFIPKSALSAGAVAALVA